ELIERRFHTRFPLDLRRSYRIHNGSGSAWFFDQGTLISLHRMRSIVDSAWKPLGKVVWNHIPFVENGGGDYCCVDCNPALGGIPGQIIWLSHERVAPEVIASGFQHYLERFTDSLERGHYIEKQYSTFAALVPCSR